MHDFKSIMEQKEVDVVSTNNEENTTNTENTDTFGTDEQNSKH